MYLGSGFYCLACWPLVSNGALAMLLLNVEASQLTTNLAWSFFRVILRCQAKGEPILVPAYLVQLGQHMLASKPSEPVHETLHESAACIKATNRACGPSAILHVGVPIGTSLWITWSFKATSPEHAAIFVVNLRRLESQQDTVLCCSGRGGILVEPRTLDAKDHHLDFQVLWVPKTDKGELFRLQQCTAWACPCRFSSWSAASAV